jgi:sugar phosphate isomerase/epimerase
VDTSLDRRRLLGGLLAATVTAGSPALAAPRRGFFERIGRPIGLQLYTLGDEVGKDLDGVFARLAAMGYGDFELPGLYGRPPAELKAAADRAGLRFSSLHLPMMGARDSATVSLVSPPQQIADTLGALGIAQVVAPILPFPANFRPKAGEDYKAAIARTLAEAGPNHWHRTADQLNQTAAALRPLGITFGYHNHNVEFAPVGKTTGWDILASRTDPALVFFEVDVGWVSAAGRDPAAFLRRLRGRVRWMHVKDVRPTTRTNFALAMDPTEVGSGRLDWKRILPAARAAGVEHFYVEQEPPFAIPRIEAAERSIGFLKTLVA